MHRIRQLLLLSAVGIVSWLAMQAVHELGHLLAACLTGGTVKRVVLHPAAISRTDVSPNPHPLIVAWAGPMVGSLGPLALLLLTKLCLVRCWARSAKRYVAFFAGFCLIANGAYIGLGGFERIGDAGDMLRHGAPPWSLAAFGVLAAALGIWIWATISREFGFGRSPREIGLREIAAAWAAAVAVLLVQLMCVMLF